MFEKKIIYVIECRTGCSCCASDNFIQGPYATETEANAVAEDYRKGIGNPLASQYAKYGVYNVEPWEIEVLPDGRWIHGDTIFPTVEIPQPILNSYGDVMI